MTKLDNSLRWYRRIVRAGIILNLFFAIPALVSPAMLTASLGLPYLDYYEWVENAGMLILSLNVFYATASSNPIPYSKLNWVVVLSRVIAVMFWTYLLCTSYYAKAFYSMFFIDLSMAIAQGVLLQRGLPPERKLTVSKITYALATPIRWSKSIYERKPLFYTTLALLIFLGVVTFELYNNLFRPRPDIVYKQDDEQFKYGAIGLGMTARIPYYIYKVLPMVFKEKFPDKGAEGYRSLGLIYEQGKDMPVGLSVRHIGYKSVEPNCAFCHTGTYRKTPGGEQKLILGSPAHELDLESFQWLLYDCAGDARFNSDTLMKYIDKIAQMGFSERLIFKHVIIPFAKSSLLKQGKAYGWQKQRPPQGRGRTDTFNPTKINVFHFPDDNTIGTVDLPQVWNQRPRENLYLHWDGNNNSLRERNYAAAMAVGATPKSVIPENFTRVTNFLLDLQPPRFPFAINEVLVTEGKKIYEAECAACHQFGQKKTGQVTELEEIDTDPHRLYSFTTQLVERFHEFRKEPFMFNAYRKTYGYSNTPLDGVWARAPYLHNGAVPTLWDLLQTSDKRPVQFYKGCNLYDSVKVGFVYTGKEAETNTFLLNTTVQGNGNQGHLYGTQLSDAQKHALIEYMKTL